ncbi:MAG: hypothetical protein ACK2UW_05765 [Anaerolineales bacterium]
METDQDEFKDQPEAELEASSEDELDLLPETVSDDENVGEPSDDSAEFTPEAESVAAKKSRKAQKKSEKAVFSINFYSWATPVVGVVMLIIGLLAGYFGRPLLAGTQDSATTGGSTSAEPTSGVSQVEPPANNASSEEVMAFLTSNVRHFRGDENAPVTMIEFSDFQ